MAFIRSTKGAVFETGNLSGFEPVRDYGTYAATDRHGVKHYFECSDVDELLTAQLPVIPCTGEYMAVAALTVIEEDNSESLDIVQERVMAWQVTHGGALLPVTFPTITGLQGVDGESVHRATDVLDLKSGKVYEFDSGTVYDSLADYEAAKNEVLKKRAEAEKRRGKSAAVAAPKN